MRAKQSQVLQALILLACIPSVAHAHPSGLVAGDAWWRAWHFDPLVVFNLVVLSIIYARGIHSLWRNAGRGRGISLWQATAFYAGIVSIAIALLSPLDTLSNDLSWLHMMQHMLLMVVAAPLVILGAPTFAMLWSLPKPWRLAAARFWLSLPQAFQKTINFLQWNILFVWALHTAVLWIWHLPNLYQLALTDPLIHDIEHLMFFLVACLFWRVAITPLRRTQLSAGASVLYLFTTSLHATALGVFMTLAPDAWYPIYRGRTEHWGLTPLEDQQIAGSIMWMPACSVYAIAAASLFGVWINALENPPRKIRYNLPVPTSESSQ